MKRPITSMSNYLKNHISLKELICVLILFLGSIGYYLEFFELINSILLSVFITTVIVSMVMVGYFRLGKKTSFPYKEFILLTLVFSIIRYIYIYFFLSKNLPSHTIFHYPIRAIPITILGTASFIFLGYSYAIYEWGLAAREKYTKMLEKNIKQLDQPIKIRSSGKWVYLLAQDILYLKANGEYVDYFTLGKRYSCFQRLKQAEIEMKKFKFLKIHRSYIINPIFVQSIGVSEVIMKDNIVLPLSKKYKETVFIQLENILLQKPTNSNGL